MNYIDILLLIIIMLSVWSGFQRGFIIGMLELISWVSSLLIGFFSYPSMARWAQEHIPSLGIWAIPLSFIVAVIIARMLISAATQRLLREIPKNAHYHIANRIFGVIPGLLNGLVWIAIVSTLLLVIPIGKRTAEHVRESKVAGTMMSTVEKLDEKVAPIFDAAIRRSINKLLIDPKTATSVKLPYTVTKPEIRADLEAEMLKMINEERAKAGIKPLQADPELTPVARAHSADMFARGYFSHFSPEGKDAADRIRSAGVGFVAAGENLALAQTLRMAHKGLMNSPGHRANILQPAFGRVGIGIMDGGVYGLMVTQNFRN